MSEVEDAGHAFTIELLNTLLEAERAGVAAVADLQQVAPPTSEVTQLLAELARDEAHYASKLRAQVKRLGGQPSSRTGDFAAKVRALATFEEKLELLDRGQRWVARHIAKHRGAVGDPQASLFLAEMAVRHELNVARSTELLHSLRPA